MSDLKDVLQIVILSFLRMKISHEALFSDKVKNSCLFIHQNVEDVNAGAKMKTGLQRLESTLDETTREAAETEKIQHIRTFNQVLEFDSNENVLYFPGLWNGQPPMAPVN